MKSGGQAGVAEWLVCATARMWIGVPMFFVISGYCIAASADSHRRNSHPPARYFLRRFRRIYPPLWGFLAIFCLFVVAAESVRPGILSDTANGVAQPASFSPWQWLESLTLTESWRYHLAGGQRGYVFGNLWTLCYEEQFYIVVGLLLLLCPKRFYQAALLVTVLVLFTERTSTGLPGFFIDGKWLEFAAGMGVFYAVNRAGRPARWLIAGALTVAPLMLLADTGQLLAFEATIPQSYACASAFALLLIALHRFDFRLFNARWTTAVTWCGTMCYSLYLVHWPIVKLIGHACFLAGIESCAATLMVTIPVSMAVSIAVASVFHQHVERRFLNAPLTQTGKERRVPKLSEPHGVREMTG